MKTGQMTCRQNSSIYPTVGAYVTMRHIWNTNDQFNCWNPSDNSYCYYHAEKGISIDSVEIKGSPANIMALSVTESISSEDFSFYWLEASYRGVSPDLFTGSELVFENGVPASIEDDMAKPVLKYWGTYSDGTPAELIADYGENFAMNSNSILNILDQSSDLECSFAGGCQFVIDAAGLASTLSKEESYIEVCGEICELDSSESDAAFAYCTLPPLVSEFSISKYEIAKHEELNIQWTDEDENLVTLLNDGDLANDYWSGAWTEPCSIYGEPAGENYQYLLSEFRLYTGEVLQEDGNPYISGLKFQGLQDDEWIDLWEVDNNVHIGWNSINLDPETTKVKQFRLYGESEKECAIAEAKVTGIKAHENDSELVACPVKLTIGQESLELNDVYYSSEKTPVLDSMSRRFVTVLGGDQVTFTGQGFESDDLGFLTGDTEISVEIDGITCDIDSQSDTEITCTSQHKPFGSGTTESQLQIYIGNKGFVATKGKFLFYVSKWSDEQTWGGFAPNDYDAV